MTFGLCITIFPGIIFQFYVQNCLILHKCWSIKLCVSLCLSNKYFQQHFPRFMTISGVLSVIKLGIQHKSTYLKSVSITWASCDEGKHMQIIFAKCFCVDYIFNCITLRESLKFNFWIKQVWIAFYTSFEDVSLIYISKHVQICSYCDLTSKVTGIQFHLSLIA